MSVYLLKIKPWLRASLCSLAFRTWETPFSKSEEHNGKHPLCWTRPRYSQASEEIKHGFVFLHSCGLMDHEGKTKNPHWTHSTAVKQLSGYLLHQPCDRAGQKARLQHQGNGIHQWLTVSISFHWLYKLQKNKVIRKYLLCLIGKHTTARPLIYNSSPTPLLRHLSLPQEQQLRFTIQGGFKTKIPCLCLPRCCLCICKTSAFFSLSLKNQFLF